MTVYILSEGFPIASVSAAQIAGAFVIWGLLMAATGVALMWLFGGERPAAADPRPYEQGRAGRGQAAVTMEIQTIHPASPTTADTLVQQVPAEMLAKNPAGRVHHTGAAHPPVGERATVPLTPQSIRRFAQHNTQASFHLSGLPVRDGSPTAGRVPRQWVRR